MVINLQRSKCRKRSRSRRRSEGAAELNCFIAFTNESPQAIVSITYCSWLQGGTRNENGKGSNNNDLRTGFEEHFENLCVDLERNNFESISIDLRA